MSFALTRFKAYGVRSEGATRKHVFQEAVLGITAANTDTALDISSMTTGSLGTFWTAVTGDASYGSLGTGALSAMQSISNIAVNLRRPDGEPFNTFLQVASGASGTQYTITVTAHMPSIAWVSGSAPTAYYIVLRWDITDGTEAVDADYGAAS